MGAPGSIWQVERWPPEWTVRHLVETGSTNTDLLAAVEAGTVGDRTALVADHQMAGRGRMDRVWSAPRGANLLVSLAFIDVPERPVSLTQRVGIATLEACRSVIARTLLARTVLGETAIGEIVSGETVSGGTAGAGDVTLKWPNDVLLDGAKVAGVLAQRSAATRAVVVGVGLNVGWAPEGAACLVGGHGGGDPNPDANPHTNPDAVTVAGVLCELLHALESLPVDCAERYRSVLGTIGRDVNVELPDGSTMSGRASDVDDTGRLLVEDADGTVHRLDVGDVVHARHTTGGTPGHAATNVSSGVPRADEVPPVA